MRLCFGYQMRLLTNESGIDDQNFICREIEAGAKTEAQVKWMQDYGIEEGKAGTLSCLRLPAPPRIPLWATCHDLHDDTDCSVPMNPPKSKTCVSALIVDQPAR